MPFTISHAVVALVFPATGLPVAAIAAGAMAPDIPLFIPDDAMYSITHGWPGALLVSVPLALALTLLWWALLRHVTYFVSPPWVRSRLPEPWSRRWRPDWSLKRFLLTPVAAAIGVVTHIVWDDFTHDGRSGVNVFPSLSRLWGPLPGYEWLQYGCSVFGLVTLVVCAVVHLIRAQPRPLTAPDPVFARTVALSALLLVAATSGAVAAAIALADGGGLTISAIDAVESPVRWMFIAGVAVGALLFLRSRSRSRSRGRPGDHPAIS